MTPSGSDLQLFPEKLVLTAVFPFCSLNWVSVSLRVFPARQYERRWVALFQDEKDARTALPAPCPHCVRRTSALVEGWQNRQALLMVLVCRVLLMVLVCRALLTLSVNRLVLLMVLVCRVLLTLLVNRVLLTLSVNRLALPLERQASPRALELVGQTKLENLTLHR